MKLSDLRDAVDEFLDRKRKGKKLKAKKIRKVLDKLEAKQEGHERDYAKEDSARAKKKLEFKRKIVEAQIKKGRKILQDLDS